MCKRTLRVLIIEDSYDDASLVRRHLRRHGYELLYARIETPDALKASLKLQNWDVIIADYSMPYFSGLAALELVKKEGIDVPFIIVSGVIGEDKAVAAMKAGARDYIMKDNLARLVPAIEREVTEAHVRRERKQAEEALRQSEADYKAVFDSVNDALLIVDLQSGRILDVNRKMCEMFGYTPEEALLINLGSLSSGEPPYTPCEALNRVKTAGEGQPQLFEWRARNKAGELFWVEVNLKRVVIGGRERVLAIIGDITERRSREERLPEYTEALKYDEVECRQLQS